MLQESGIARQTRRSILSLEAIHLRQRVHAALLVILIHPTRTRKPVRHGQPELESAPVRQKDVKQALRDSMAVEGYIDNHNENPKPFIWTAKAADILEKVKRARRARHNRPSA
jgi:hypothetical protein